MEVYVYKTPKKLKKINILGKDIPIVIDDSIYIKNNDLGQSNGTSITLLSKYESFDEFVDVLSHECFHVLSYVLGTQLNETVEEILANTMGQMNVNIINKLLECKAFVGKKGSK